MTRLKNNVIDCHSHAGISFKNYACGEYPYAETIESLYYKQLANGVDVNVVFPLAPELFYDIEQFVRSGCLVESNDSLDSVPYKHENAFLLKEVNELCPELLSRFLPFVCFSPKSHFQEQLREIELLCERYEVFGIKINPALCQGYAKDLLGVNDLFAFAAEKNIPFLFHSSCIKEEEFSYAEDILKLAEQYDNNRFCLAHCIGFHRPFLDQADSMENVWVDSAALKIQVQLAYENSPLMAPVSDRIDANYSDHKKVMATLVDAYPETMIWGSDAPAYTYIVDRKNADGTMSEFKLKARYEDEKAALDYLQPHQKKNASNINTLKFLGSGLRHLRRNDEAVLN